MSHFTVMVVTDKPEDLEAALQPFHEYECTGIKDEYVIWVDETEEKLKEYKEDTIPMVCRNGEVLFSKYSDQAKKFWRREEPYAFTSKDKFELPEGFTLEDVPANKVYPTVKEYMIEWCGYEEDNFVGDTIGRLTNPNAKWDWYQIGGRWSNKLATKSGGNTDQCKVGDISLQKMKMQRKAERIANWSQFSLRPEKEQNDKFIREYLHNIKEGMTEKEYISTDEGFSTFAVVKDGEWYQRGDMGWWGCVSEEKDQNDWNEEFAKLFESLPEDKYVTIVDCHI